MRKRPFDRLADASGNVDPPYLESDRDPSSQFDHADGKPSVPGCNLAHLT